MIRSGWGNALPRRLVLVAVAALIPLLAGCEAGNEAPTVAFHPPTETASIAVGDLAVRNVFVLGAPLGSQLSQGQSASLFLSMVNTGAPDRLLGITAPGTAASVTVPTGGITVKAGPPVLLSGPQPVLVLTDLSQPLVSGSSVKIVLDFARTGLVTLQVPVFAMAAQYQTFAPPQPSASVATLTPATKHHKLHLSPSPSTSASLPSSPSPSPSAS